MSVVSIFGRDTAAEARALVHFMLQHGDIVGTDHAGRAVLKLAVDQWTLDQLCAFDAGAEDLEDADGEPEPDQEHDGPAVVLDFVPPKRISRAARLAKPVALALLLVTAPLIDARADQAPAMTRALPMSTAQAPQQLLPDVHEGSGVRRRVHQRREAVHQGARMRVLCWRRGCRIVMWLATAGASPASPASA